jgi:thiol-disulfide isomerase/thioredoxin
MKKILIVILCLVLALSVMGCGKSADEGEKVEVTTGDTGLATGETFSFSTTTFGGDAFTREDIADANLVMVNLWEPWCGPCVEEMPDLERIYEENQGSGFVVLGVFWDDTMDDDARATLESAGITYPILRGSKDFERFQTSYVPTTVFLAGDGTILSEEPLIGSRSYEDWNAIVQGLLEGLE